MLLFPVWSSFFAVRLILVLCAFDSTFVCFMARNCSQCSLASLSLLCVYLLCFGFFLPSIIWVQIYSIKWFCLSIFTWPVFSFILVEHEQDDQTRQRNKNLKIIVEIFNWNLFQRAIRFKLFLLVFIHIEMDVPISWALRNKKKKKMYNQWATHELC